MKPSVISGKFSVYINAFFEHTSNESKKMGIKIGIKKRAVIRKIRLLTGVEPRGVKSNYFREDLNIF
jgi:hypothetical protein